MKRIAAVIICISLFIFTFYELVKPKPMKDNKIAEAAVAQNYTKEDPDITILKIAHRFPESHPQHIALSQKFASIVEEESNWKIRVEIYPNNQLGSENEFIEGIRKGTIEMCIGRQSLYTTLNKLRITEFPYIFENYKQAFGVLNGDLSEVITQGLEVRGFHVLGWTLNGFHQLSMFNSPLKTNDKGSKLKIATSASQPNDIILNSMGFDAVQSDTDDMAILALQKITDGADFPLLMSYTNRAYRGQRYIYITNHAISADMYIVSSDFWERLPNNYKEIIEKAANESAKYELGLLEDWEKDIVDELKSKGTEINYPDLSEYKKSALPLYDRLINSNEELRKVFNKLLDEKSKYNGGANHN